MRINRGKDTKSTHQYFYTEVPFQLIVIQPSKYAQHADIFGVSKKSKRNWSNFSLVRMLTLFECSQTNRSFRSELCSCAASGSSCCRGVTFHYFEIVIKQRLAVLIRRTRRTVGNNFPENEHLFEMHKYLT